MFRDGDLSNIEISRRDKYIEIGESSTWSTETPESRARGTGLPLEGKIDTTHFEAAAYYVKSISVKNKLPNKVIWYFF